jgi:hypothetical protein
MTVIALTMDTPIMCVLAQNRHGVNGRDLNQLKLNNSPMISSAMIVLEPHPTIVRMGQNNIYE